MALAALGGREAPSITQVRCDAWSNGAAGKLASRLREELGYAGISATVSSGFGLALVMAGRVNVWVEFGPQGWGFRWWTGRVSDRGLRDYTFCPASAVETAVRLIGARVHQVRLEAVSAGELVAADRKELLLGV